MLSLEQRATILVDSSDRNLNQMGEVSRKYDLVDCLDMDSLHSEHHAVLIFSVPPLTSAN